MDLPQAVVDHLTDLTETLGVPGADLQAMLEVLLDDVVTAVPSFCGLRLTVLTSQPAAAGLLMDVPTSDPPAPARASLHLPIPSDTGEGISSGSVSGSTAVTFYAGTAGAFVDLAADLRFALGLDGEVVTDRHLHHWPPDAGTGDQAGGDQQAEAAADAAAVNQAVGFLIGGGYLPEAALTELLRQAHARGISAAARARQLLAGD